MMVMKLLPFWTISSELTGSAVWVLSGFLAIVSPHQTFFRADSHLLPAADI
jgi:hypothetical protein